MWPKWHPSVNWSRSELTRVHKKNMTIHWIFEFMWSGSQQTHEQMIMYLFICYAAATSVRCFQHEVDCGRWKACRQDRWWRQAEDFGVCVTWKLRSHCKKIWQASDFGTKSELKRSDPMWHKGGTYVAQRWHKCGTYVAQTWHIHGTCGCSLNVAVDSKPHLGKKKICS